MIVLTKNGTTGELRFAHPGEEERDVVGKTFRIRTRDENGNFVIVKDEVVEVLIDDDTTQS